jgi:predicted NBD/HSP70 family sugar kinase
VSAVADDTRTRRATTATGLGMRCEVELVFAAKDDPLARARLLEAFRPLVVSVARRYAFSIGPPP